MEKIRSDASATEPAEADVLIGTRGQLLHLLAEAAEVEHTLMCSYLYAAFSLKRRDAAGLSAAEGDACERWRKTIMSVATEEMGHLLIVSNLTAAVGGRPHFARPNFPVLPGYFPSGVVVRLSAFSKDTLQHFIFLERPQGVSGHDGAAYETDHYSRERAYHGLMPGGQDYTTIGHLYEAIRANLIALSDRLGEAGLFVGGPGSQLGPRVADLPGIAAIGTLQEACAGIDIIVEQGEGARDDRDDSHYRSFLAIDEEYERLAGDNRRFQPAWPVADNPTLWLRPALDDQVSIDHPAAAALLDFACATYGMLLRLLVQSFGRQGAARLARQERLFSAAMTLMHVLAEVSDALAQTPASATASGVNAGMSFTMLRAIEPLLAGPTEERLLQEQLHELAAHATQRGLASGAALATLAGSFRL